MREVTFPGDNNRPEGAWPCSNQNERWTGRAHHERIMSTELAEIGNAQVVVRNANETIQASADRFTIVRDIPFICECPDPNCSEVVNLGFDTYEAIRQSPRHFFNVSGHEASSVAAGAERIIAVSSAA